MSTKLIRIRPVNKTHLFFLNAPAFRALRRNSDPVMVIQDSSVQKSSTIVNWGTIIHWEVDKSHGKRDSVKAFKDTERVRVTLHWELYWL